MCGSLFRFDRSLGFFLRQCELDRSGHFTHLGIKQGYNIHLPYILGDLATISAMATGTTIPPRK